MTLGASILGLFLKNWFIIGYLLHNKIFFHASWFGHHTFVQLWCWELIVVNSRIQHWHEKGFSLLISHWLLRFVLASLMEVWIEFWKHWVWLKKIIRQLSARTQVLFLVGYSCRILQASYPPQQRDSSSTSSIKDSRVIRRLWLKLFVNPSLRTTVVVGQNTSVVSCWLLLSQSFKSHSKIVVETACQPVLEDHDSRRLERKHRFLLATLVKKSFTFVWLLWRDNFAKHLFNQQKSRARHSYKVSCLLLPSRAFSFWSLDANLRNISQ